MAQPEKGHENIIVQCCSDTTDVKLNGLYERTKKKSCSNETIFN